MPEHSANINSSSGPFPSMEEGKSSILMGDKEFFIRKAFESVPEEGIELLFKAYYKPLCNHAIRFVYSKEVAEDIVADIFLSFWKGALYEKIKNTYRTYLFAAVRFNSVAYLKKEIGTFITDELDKFQITSTLPDPLQILQYDELYLKIESLINSLPPQCRKVFIMNRYEAKKYQEISAELKISIKTVEVHISKALKTIRAGLKIE